MAITGAEATITVAKKTSTVHGRKGICRQDGRDDHQDRSGGQQDRRGYRPVTAKAQACAFAYGASPTWMVTVALSPDAVVQVTA